MTEVQVKENNSDWFYIILGTELYERLVPYLLTEEQLKENNFPRPDPVTSGKAVFLGEDIHAQKARTKGTGLTCTTMLDFLPFCVEILMPVFKCLSYKNRGSNMSA